MWALLRALLLHRLKRAPAGDHAPPSQSITVDAPTVLNGSMKTFFSTILFVLGGGACARAAGAAAFMAAAFTGITADESTSVDLLELGLPVCCSLVVPGHEHALFSPPTQAMTANSTRPTSNWTGGAAAAAASRGSPTSPHPDGDLCCDLVQGSGGEKRGTPNFWGAWRRSPAQHFPFPSITSRCGCALLAPAATWWWRLLLRVPWSCLA